MNEKKPLSDWLIASDIDGTLNNKLRLLPKRNFEAIQKYTKDFGGKFILASGRSINSMRKHFKRLKIDSGICVFTNGAGIYDYSSERILWLKEMDAELVARIKDVISTFWGANMQVITPQEVFLVRPTVSALIMAANSRLEKRVFTNYSSLPEEQWCKVIFLGSPWKMDKLQKVFTELNGGDTTNLMRSSICSFEIVSAGTNKGVAVLEAAKLLGIDKSHTAAIGDYFNDLEMLKTVALPAVCGQAPSALKKIGKIVTCSCNKGAVADLIEYLISKYA